MIKRFTCSLFQTNKLSAFLFCKDLKNNNIDMQVLKKNNGQKVQTQKKQHQQQTKPEKQNRMKIIYQILFWSSVTVLGYHTYLVHQHKKKTPVENEPTAIPGFITAGKLLYKSINQTTEFFTKPPLQKLLPDVVDPSMHPKTLVLNLSGTLLQTQIKEGKGLFVNKRPGLQNFLKKMSQIYEVIIFSDQDSMLINTIAQSIDPRRTMIAGYFGNQCLIFSHGHFIKDLKYLNRDLNKVIVIDENKDKVQKHQQNVITISKYKGDQNDRQLVQLSNLLQSLAHPDIKDVRKRLQQLGQNPIRAYQQTRKVKQEKTKQTKNNNKMFGFFQKKK